MTMTPAPPAVGSKAPDGQATPLRRFVPALLATQLGFCIAVFTPLQLLLALRLDEMAGDGANKAFGLVTGIGALCALLSNPIAGRASDRTRARFGRRRTWMLTGSLALALVLTALSATTAVWQVALLWSLAQVVGNFQFAANNAILADQIPPARRGGVSGLVGAVAAIGPLAGIGLANTFPAGGSLQWLSVAIASVGLTVLAVLLLRDPRSTAPKPPLNLRTLLGTFWFNPWRHPAFGWAWLVRFLIMATHAAVGYTTLFLMQRFDISKGDVGSVVLGISAVTLVSVAAVSVIAGYLSDRLRRQLPFVVFAGLTAALGLVLMAAADSIAAVYVASAVLGVGTGTFLAVDLALCVRVLPSAEDAGKDLAIINIANSLPQSLVPFAAPALLAIGGYPALFLTLAALGLLGAAAILRVPEIGREAAPGRAAPITRT
ncbi:MFS transporter [Streptomyces sp. NPDC046925]|uniref:MFS transporter n=1 Tax=Streptomyces sp. NPDC046925 TaxID=3155375 RepID=UPI0033D8BA89